MFDTLLFYSFSAQEYGTLVSGAPDKPCGEAVQMLTQKLVAKRYMIAKK